MNKYGCFVSTSISDSYYSFYLLALVYIY